MLVLWEQDDVLVKEIGEHLYLDSGTLTPLLKRLEASALIVRTRDQADERQVRVTLSANGKALRQKAREIPLQILCASGQSSARVQDLRRQLSQMRDQLVRAQE